MKPIADLHIHSLNSDGSLNPNQIKEACRHRGIEYVITDHDWVTRNNDGIEGVEISAQANGLGVHILGYSNHFTNIDQMNRDLYVNREELTKQGKEMLNNISKSWKEIDVHYGAFLAKSKIIRACIREYGHDKNHWLQFTESHNGWQMSVKRALKIIHTHGGIAILAHPNRIKGDWQEIFNEYDFDGLEAHHYSGEINYDGICTGGSDYHAVTDHAQSIGDYGVNEDEYEMFKLALNDK